MKISILRFFTSVLVISTLLWSSLLWATPLTTQQCVDGFRPLYERLQTELGVTSNRGNASRFGNNTLNETESARQLAIMQEVSQLADRSFLKVSRAFLNMQSAIRGSTDQAAAIEAHLMERLGGDTAKVRVLKDFFNYIDQEQSNLRSGLIHAPNVVRAIEALRQYTSTDPEALRIQGDDVYLIRHMMRHAQDTFCRDSRTNSTSALRFLHDGMTPAGTLSARSPGAPTVSPKLQESEFYNQMLTIMHDTFSRRDFARDKEIVDRRITDISDGTTPTRLRDYENTRFKTVMDIMGELRNFLHVAHPECKTPAVTQALLRYQSSGGLHFRVASETDNRCNLAHFLRSIYDENAISTIEPLMHFMNANYMTRGNHSDLLRDAPKAVFAMVEASNVSCTLNEAGNALTLNLNLSYIPQTPTGRPGWRTRAGDRIQLQALSSLEMGRDQEIRNDSGAESNSFNLTYPYTGVAPREMVFYDPNNRLNNIRIVRTDTGCRVDTPIIDTPVITTPPVALSLELTYKTEAISGPNEEIVAKFKKGAALATAADLTGNMTWSYACEASEATEGITRNEAGNCSISVAATPESEKAFPRKALDYPVTVTYPDITQSINVRHIVTEAPAITYGLSISHTNEEKTYRLTAVPTRTPPMENIAGTYVWNCIRTGAAPAVAPAGVPAGDSTATPTPTPTPTATPTVTPTAAATNLCSTTSDPKIVTVEQKEFAIEAKVTFTPADQTDQPKEARYTVPASTEDNDCDISGTCDPTPTPTPTATIPPPPSENGAGGRPPTFTPTQLPPPPGFNIKYGVY